MAAEIVDMAEAILTDLNADPENNFGRAFVAIRTNGEFPFELKEGVFRVDVVPFSHVKADPMDRVPNVDHQMAVSIAVREGLQRNEEGLFNNEDVDPLRLILQKIQRFFIYRELTTLTDATFVSSEYVTDGLEEYLTDHDTYVGIVRVTYELVQ